MSPRRLSTIVLVGGTLCLVGLPALSQQASAATDHAERHAAPAAAAEMASGEVRRIDKAAGKMTLRHGEIKGLDMPPMTMVFQVLDAAFLDRVKVGDKIRFRADQQGGAYRVIELQLAN